MTLTAAPEGYRTFGGGSAEIVRVKSGPVWAVDGAGQPLQWTVWSSRAGGTQITDLLDGDGNPLPGYVSPIQGTENIDEGLLMFFAPDTASVVYVDRGYGLRIAVWAQEIASQMESAISKADFAYNTLQQLLGQLDADDGSSLARTFSVDAQGAVGDGVTDDTVAIQAALDACAAAGGGQVLLSPGKTYWMQSYARIQSNTWVIGYGATIIKNTTPGRYAIFATQSKGTPGYGTGGRGIRVSGVTVRGDLAQGVGACLLSLHHTDDVLVEQCNLVGALVGGHGLDVCGSRHVTIRDCTFAGRAPGNANKEAIQVDQSGDGSMSAPDDPGSFDGLPSSDVQVLGCRFIPLVEGGVTYPAPFPFGSHTVPGAGGTAGLGLYYTDLTFRGNLVQAPDDDTASYPRGAVHFVAAQRVKIDGNTFIAGGDAPLIGAFSKVLNGTEYRNSDVTITGNTIRGVTATQSPIDIRKTDGVTITGNRLPATGSTAAAIAVTSCTRLLLHGNDLEADSAAAQPVGISIASSATGRVAGNLVTGFTQAITADASSSTVVIAADNITS